LPYFSGHTPNIASCLAATIVPLEASPSTGRITMKAGILIDEKTGILINPFLMILVDQPTARRV
jgi:hypothetical protein